MKTNEELSDEIGSFKDLWKGGTTLAKNGWDCVAKQRDINSIYEICIEPYVNDESNVLEIGCNGGGWTRRMLQAKTVTCFDALSAKHTGFWNNISVNQTNVKYHHVNDFNCNELEDNSIDYVFSYDVFCHISYSGTKAYLENLYKKLTNGTNLFIMIADIDKYKDLAGLHSLRKRAGFKTIQELVDDYDGEAKNGRWFFYGIDRFCDLLNDSGYQLVNRDVMGDKDPRSPTIHFKK